MGSDHLNIIISGVIVYAGKKSSDSAHLFDTVLDVQIFKH